MAKDASCSLGYVDGLIAYALEIVVDARDGKDKAEIDGHQLMESEELEDAVVDFELEFVDGVFFIEDTLGELFVGFEDGVDGLVDGALGEAAHPEQALFQFVQVFFEVAFHENFPSVVYNPERTKSRFLGSLGMTIERDDARRGISRSGR
jgi:hypothetical protein